MVRTLGSNWDLRRHRVLVLGGRVGRRRNQRGEACATLTVTLQRGGRKYYSLVCPTQKAVDIIGYWYCSPSSHFNLASDSDPDEKVFIYLHSREGYDIDTAYTSGFDIRTILTPFPQISKNIQRVLTLG